jgi:hypothetical protein
VQGRLKEKKRKKKKKKEKESTCNNVLRIKINTMNISLCIDWLTLMNDLRYVYTISDV